MGLDRHGRRITKSALDWPCDICAKSTEPGQLWLGGGDWVTCPQCNGSGKIDGTLTQIMPTRKIILPTRQGVERV